MSRRPSSATRWCVDQRRAAGQPRQGDGASAGRQRQRHARRRSGPRLLRRGEVGVRIDVDEADLRRRLFFLPPAGTPARRCSRRRARAQTVRARWRRARVPRANREYASDLVLIARPIRRPHEVLIRRRRDIAEILGAEARDQTAFAQHLTAPGSDAAPCHRRRDESRCSTALRPLRLRGPCVRTPRRDGRGRAAPASAPGPRSRR